MFLNEITFNKKKDYMGTDIGAYRRTESQAKFGKIIHSKDRQYIAIELIKDHLFGSPDFKTIEIAIFRAVLKNQEYHKFMKTKVTINVEKGISYDFNFSDEVTQFNVPYVYFMHQTMLKVISPLTNKIVKTIDFSQSLLA